MYDRFGVDKLIELWLAEDVGQGDLSVILIAPDAQARFQIVPRESLIVAGIEVAARVFQLYDPSIQIIRHAQDGQRAEAGMPMLTVAGNARSMLTAERTALNILQHLCGVASETARYVAEIADTHARLVDTRKTMPGLRMLDKHATRCGGALNHRLGLDSGAMIKDNHIAVHGSIGAAVRNLRQHLPILTKLEVECDRLDQVEEAVAAGVDVVLLDNMDLDTLRAAVALVDGRALTEASGGIRLETIRAVAQTGVDYISTSRITQAAVAVDIGMDACA